MACEASKYDILSSYDCKNVEVEVFIQKVVKRDKFKTGQDETVEKEILHKKSQCIPIGRIPVMVKSVLCNTVEKGKDGEEDHKKGDCAFDQGGYFVIKGAEKVSFFGGFKKAYIHTAKLLSRQTPGQLLEAALSKGIACPI